MQKSLKSVVNKENIHSIFENFIQKQSIFKNKKVLTANYIPDEILHRDQEIQQLSNILAPSLRGHQPNNVFIYGTVGTGKSITVRFVLNELKSVTQKTNKKVKPIYINCKMKKVADTEYRLIAQMLKEFNEIVPETGLPTDVLYRKFFDCIDVFNGIIIIVLDEIDTLVQKVGDEFLYNLTRINSELKRSQVSLIGITNNLSIVDVLDIRVKSSLGEEEIVFKPYNAKELANILLQRVVEGFNKNVVDEAVINKCAALAAQEHGDARRALDLLRVAGEIAERMGDEKVLEKHVDIAEKKIDTDRIIETVRSQPKQSQIVLFSIINSLNNGKVSTGDVFNQYKKICNQIGVKILTKRRFSDLISELDMLSIISTNIISKGRYGRTREIIISIDEDILEKLKQILSEKMGL